MPSPELVLHQTKPNCKVSIILLDWSVRESFHSLHYLNQQNVSRDAYELIWLEFYGRKPLKLQEMVFRQGRESPLLDQWIVAGYSEETIFNKHRLYNLGLLVSQGQYCVICDSDAIFTPNFVAKVLEGFAQTPHAVLHMDEIRNADPRFHPFAYPSIEEVLGPGCINWNGDVSRGVDVAEDKIHAANYGACMAAAREDLLAIGGADEHLDYLGYICGPYDLTFRLVNHGLAERWLRDEYIYHVWHPNESGINTDYQGPNDGRGMSLRSLEARATGRVEPFLENPWIARQRAGEKLEVRGLLSLLADREESTWRVGNQPSVDDAVCQLERDYHGFNLFTCRRHWYALKIEDGYFNPKISHCYRVLLDGKDAAHVKHLIDYYNSLPKQWWRRLGTQPLYRLPGRAARKIGKEISRLF
jgi:hypothetical protein